jgi:hypothetical protein
MTVAAAITAKGTVKREREKRELVSVGSALREKQDCPLQALTQGRIDSLINDICPRLSRKVAGVKESERVVIFFFAACNVRELKLIMSLFQNHMSFFFALNGCYFRTASHAVARRHFHFLYGSLATRTEAMR